MRAILLSAAIAVFTFGAAWADEDDAIDDGGVGIEEVSEDLDADDLADIPAIGAIWDLDGTGGTVTRANGDVEILTQGTPIYDGDVVRTNEDGDVNIMFVDETEIPVSKNGKLIVNGADFEEAPDGGTSAFSYLKRIFVWTSGLIGSNPPDAPDNTGSLGIRG